MFTLNPHIHCQRYLIRYNNDVKYALVMFTLNPHIHCQSSLLETIMPESLLSLCSIRCVHLGILAYTVKALLLETTMT